MYQANTHLGFYKVGGRAFLSKIDALLHSTNTNQKPIYHYHDEVWDLALKSYRFNPNTSFLDLYKQRAQMVRDSFDYLVLHFSGGVDSTTVLQSFVHNNIRLDEVYVRWPIKLINSTKYTPDPYNRNATNMLSEWDFSIKPKLDWLRANHPEVKIVIEDWTDELYRVKSDTFSETLFRKHNHNFGLANFIYSEMVSKTSLEAQSKGLEVAHIYGAEKPMITYDAITDAFYMYFTDINTASVGFQHSFNKFNTLNRVDFYHSTNLPELTISRATAMALHIRRNPSLLYLVDSSNAKLDSEERSKRSDKFQKLCAKVIYPNWDTSTFQVDKIDVSNRLYHPWYHYVFNNIEFIDKQKRIESVFKDITLGLSDNFKSFDNNDNAVGVLPIRTKFFRLNEN